MGILRLLKALLLHADRLGPIFEQLPDILPNVGDGMAAGGDACVATGQVLSGVNDRAISVRRTLLDLTQNIQFWSGELNAASTRLHAASRLIRAVQVPTVSPDYTEFWGVNVVTGLSLGSVSLFEPVSDELSEVARYLDNMHDSLDASVQHLHQLASLTEQVGANVGALGAALKEGGNVLQVGE